MVLQLTVFAVQHSSLDFGSLNIEHGFLLNEFFFLGLAFDSWDLDYYTKLFKETIKRNPTNIECFDLAQSNRYKSHNCWLFRLPFEGSKFKYTKSNIDLNLQFNINISDALDLFYHKKSPKKNSCLNLMAPEMDFLVADDYMYFNPKTPMNFFKSWHVWNLSIKILWTVVDESIYSGY